MVNDFPATARFLTPEEKLRALRRLRADGQAAAETEKLSRKYIFAAMKDWKTWGYAVCYMGCLMPLYSEYSNDMHMPGPNADNLHQASLFSCPPFSSVWDTRERPLSSCPSRRTPLLPL